MMKVLCIFGTRPEAIKMAPVIRELRRVAGNDRTDAPDVTVKVCVTGQHRQMLDQVLRLFEIDPDYDLDIMEANQSLARLTANALTALDPLIAREAPDWVLVQGDTTTAMAGALAAFYHQGSTDHQLRVGHVEAGLRTWDKLQPFPEEINRKIAAAVCDLHFAPTETARRNLLREGIADDKILVTGNTVIDALHWAAAIPSGPEEMAGQRPHLGNPGVRLILVTAHRRENFGKPLENICVALRAIAEQYGSAVRIVYPVHLNPNVQEPVNRLLKDVPNITLLPPMDYLPLVHLMKQSYLVLTDSGGIQEEAPGLGKPVLVLRETTERPEAVEAGTVRIVGTDVDRIVSQATRLLEDDAEYGRMASAVNPYGDGHAAERIVDALVRSTASALYCRH